MTGKVGELLVRSREDEGGVLAGSDPEIGVESLHISFMNTERCMGDGTDWMTSIPARGLFCIGLVALLGSSGPCPSSPDGPGVNRYIPP